MNGRGFLGRSRALRVGRNAVHGTQDHQFRIALLRALAAEKIPQDRNIAQAGNLVVNVGNAIVHQTRDHKALAVLQFKFGFRFARA
jgi:hypothetical protein